MASYSTSVSCTVIGKSVEDNTSTVRIVFSFVRTDYTCYGWSDSTYYNISCHGQSTGDIGWLGSWNIGQNQWCQVGYHDFTVGHNSDGTLSIGYSGYLNFGGASPGALSATGSTALPTIPRYLSSNSLTLNSVTQTSANISWAASDKSSWVRCYLNDSSSWTDVPGSVNTSSGTFNYTGYNGTNASVPTVSTLMPGTTYRLKASIRRSDSGLWGTSSGAPYTQNISFTTTEIASISNNNINFNIGSDLDLTFRNYNLNNSYLKLYGKNANGEWVLVTSVSESVKADSYKWALSGATITNALYALCPNANSLEIKIVCGTTINGVDYNNENCMSKSEIKGVASVVNANPTFSNFSIANDDSKCTSLFGANYMLTGFGNMIATISTTNKMVALKGANPVRYEISYGYGNNIRTTSVPYQTNNISLELGTFLEYSSNYYVQIKAYDSRGNYTSVTKTFVVLEYHEPYITATLERYNHFEKEVLMTFRTSISKLTVGSVNNNSFKATTYKVKYAESTSYGNEISVPDVASSSNSSDFILTSERDTYLNKFVDMDITRSYDVMFTVTDCYMTRTYTVPVPQGTAIFEMRADNKVLVGIAPDEKMQNESSLLQVSGDIAMRYTDGNGNDGYRRVFEDIDSLNSDLNSVFGSWITEKKNIIDCIYPIGSQIYNSKSTFDPNTLYRGTTWERIRGYVLGGIDENDSDENKPSCFNQISGTKIGNKNPPLHDHGLFGGSHTFTWGIGGLTSEVYIQNAIAAPGAPPNNNLVTSQGYWNKTDKNANGGNAKNIQPTQLTYIWERTA